MLSEQSGLPTQKLGSMQVQQVWTADRVWRKIVLPLFKHIPIWLVILGTMFPIYFAIITSIKTKDEYAYNKVLPSAAPTLANWAKVVAQPDFFVWFRNSVVVMLATALLSVVAGSLSAFAFSQLRFVGRDRLLHVILSLLVFPSIVLAIPLFIVFARLGMLNTLPTVIIIYMGVTSPFTLFILTGFFRTIPREILDAALIDGCSNTQLIWHILVPLTRTALITVATVNALFVWNELLMAVIFLQRESVKTLMAGMTFQTRFGVLDVPYAMAGLVLSTLPMIVLYLVGQQYFIKGLTVGALKG
jgi:raffinose/stachyose/melibiose transport system permease protein